MFGAGILSGLLGIGSGAVKVLVMDRVMGLPFKISTTTSKLHDRGDGCRKCRYLLARGYINAGIAMPVMLGVLVGSLLGSKLLVKAHIATLR